MKLTMNAGALASGLRAIAGTIKRRSDLPILKNVHLEASGSQFCMTATNLDQQGQVSFATSRIAQEGAITTDLLALSGIAQRLPGKADVSISLDGNQLNIVSGRTKCGLQTLATSNWTFLGEGGRQEAQFSLDAERFQRALSRVAHAMARDDRRPALEGIFIEPDPAGDPVIHVTATDGYRLATYALYEDASFDPVIIPRVAVGEIIKVCERSGSEPVQVTLLGNHAASLMKVDGQDETFTTKLIDGQYVDWRRVMPAPGKAVASFDPQAMKTAIELVISPSEGTKKTPSVALRFLETECEVFLNNQQREARTSIASDCTFDTSLEEPTIASAFNARYLAEALGEADKEGSQLHIVDPATPVLLAAPGEPFQQVVTPQRGQLP